MKQLKLKEIARYLLVHCVKVHCVKVQRVIMPCVIVPCIISSLTGCGSGGSGDNTDSDFLGAARVSINVSPTKIDTGDRIQVNVELSDIHPDGILLKIKYPTALKFVPDSSKLIANNKNSTTSPLFDLDNSDDEHFLVYLIRQSSFGTPKKGRLNFELQGISEILRADIEVDPDVDNPLLNNAEEFDVEEPEFTAEDKTKVEVQP